MTDKEKDKQDKTLKRKVPFCYPVKENVTGEGNKEKKRAGVNLRSSRTCTVCVCVCTALILLEAGALLPQKFGSVCWTLTLMIQQVCEAPTLH